MAAVPPHETLSYEEQERRLQEAIGLVAMWRGEAAERSLPEARAFAALSAEVYAGRARHMASNVRHLVPDGQQIAAEVDREGVLFEADG